MQYCHGYCVSIYGALMIWILQEVCTVSADTNTEMVLKETPLSVLKLISSLVAASPYLLVTIILGVKCYRARGHHNSQYAMRVIEE
ncbi:hypothetical protein AMELA_G00060020 [Ameiurus melas]|uniref:Uncharacterized protein n=1 Tax=Ameiurus melas TaxID=219545 RepID=A0A7J6B1B1_AMEME|nr:hypothetical protein AMELA_G00060020 [Ameiurus melas]